MPASLRPALATAVLAGVLVLGACTLRSARGAGELTGGQLVTAAMIEGAGLSTGWDVLRHFAEHLSLDEHTARGPTSVSRRGRESIYLTEDPLLLLDGVRTSDFRALATLPAREIESMRILSSMEATTRYGMRAASGAIVVRTIRPTQ